VDRASVNGHIKVLNWWKQSGMKMKWSANALDFVSQSGQIEVVDWWKQSGLEMIQ